jgi:hypothetical protein
MRTETRMVVDQENNPSYRQTFELRPSIVLRCA